MGGDASLVFPCKGGTVGASKFGFLEGPVLCQEAFEDGKLEFIELFDDFFV